MRKWLGWIALVLVGLMLGAGSRFLLTLYPLTTAGNSAPAAASPPQVQANPPQNSAETEAESTADSAETPSSQTDSLIPEAEPDKGELIVEGMVDNVSTKRRTITFSQELNDNSKKVNPKVKVLKEAIIEINSRKSEFDQITVGDYVTMILNEKHEARAVQISR